jgi:hypothetical protein
VLPERPVRADDADARSGAGRLHRLSPGGRSRSR